LLYTIHQLKNNQAPIGIFDSGIGGLTVADAIRKILPGEKIIYFGDTAHLPYGDKAPGSIKSYTKTISDFLISRGCKMIVVACNSASSIAFDEVKEHVKGKSIPIDVISPVVEKITRLKNSKKIGVIGTRATIRSGEYTRQVHAKNPNIEVVSVATPLLAPMIEEGFFNNNISKTIIQSYLSKPRLKNIDRLILACTHYPLIMDELNEYYNGKVSIINSAEIVADKVKSTLRRRKLIAAGKAGPHEFYISDYTKSFEKSTKIFFSGKIKPEHLNLWNNK
jgi:glutamate racemase